VALAISTASLASWFQPHLRIHHCLEHSIVSYKFPSLLADCEICCYVRVYDPAQAFPPSRSAGYTLMPANPFEKFCIPGALWHCNLPLSSRPSSLSPSSTCCIVLYSSTHQLSSSSASCYQTSSLFTVPAFTSKAEPTASALNTSVTTRLKVAPLQDNHSTGFLPRHICWGFPGCIIFGQGGPFSANSLERGTRVLQHMNL